MHFLSPTNSVKTMKAENRLKLADQSPHHLDISVVVLDVVVADAASIEMSRQSAGLSDFHGINAQLRQTIKFVLIVQIVISRQLNYSKLVLRPSTT